MSEIELREKLLKSILAGKLDDIAPLSSEDAAQMGDELKGRLKSLQIQQAFDVGALVCWKPGMKNKKRPRYGEPAIVVEVLPAPLMDSENDPGSSYYREPLDIVLGIIDNEGDFVLFHFDSRRFMPYTANA